MSEQDPAVVALAWHDVVCPRHPTCPTRAQHAVDLTDTASMDTLLQFTDRLDALDREMFPGGACEEETASPYPGDYGVWLRCDLTPGHAGDHENSETGCSWARNVDADNCPPPLHLTDAGRDLARAMVAINARAPLCGWELVLSTGDHTGMTCVLPKGAHGFHEVWPAGVRPTRPEVPSTETLEAVRRAVAREEAAERPLPDDVEVGTCKACGQVLGRHRESGDVWHPWYVDVPCPPELPLPAVTPTAWGSPGRPGPDNFVPTPTGDPA